MQRLELSLTDEPTGRTVARSIRISDAIAYDPLAFAKAVGNLRVALSEDIHTPAEDE